MACSVTVRLWTEGAGHRVPTGFIDKHLILLVDGEDAAGKPVALQSGPRLPAVAGKELEGRPGKLYAKLLHDFDGHSPAPFWRADPEAVDTRLTPGRTDESEFVLRAGSDETSRSRSLSALLAGSRPEQRLAGCGYYGSASRG